MTAAEPALAALEARLGHTFQERALLRRALTHRSAGADHNERLEFLGDAALGCAIAGLLFEAHPGAVARDLSLMRASLVKNDTLAAIAREIDLGAALTLGMGEKRAGAREAPSILADAFEAVLGAVLRDGGADALRAVVSRCFGARLLALRGAPSKDAKTRLQELVQGRGMPLPDYRVERVEGADHARRFVVRCRVGALDLDAAAAGNSRREAEQRAAEAVLGRLSC